MNYAEYVANAQKYINAARAERLNTLEHCRARAEEFTQAADEAQVGLDEIDSISVIIVSEAEFNRLQAAHREAEIRRID